MSTEKTIERFADVTVTLEDGTELPLRFKPFTRDEFVAFMEGFSPIENPASAKAVYRKADEDSLSWPLVRAKRLQEMSPEQRDAHSALERTEAKSMMEFCAATIAAYVRISPGVALAVVDFDGNRRTISTGEDLAREFSGDPMALGAIVRALAEENVLSAQKKTNLLRRSASLRSSSVPPPAAPGPSPVAIAGSAAPSPDSATSAPAPALPEPTLSSVTA